MKHCFIHPTEYYEDTCPQCQPVSEPPLASAHGSALSPVDISDAALEELGNAAIEYAAIRKKEPQNSSFAEWSDACDRLEAAAIQWAKTQMPNVKGE